VAEIAFVDCEQCGAKVSAQVKACPHCGLRPYSITKRALIGFPLAILFYSLLTTGDWMLPTAVALSGVSAVLIAERYALRFLKRGGRQRS
jgi:hypothetical protein